MRIGSQIWSCYSSCSLSTLASSFDFFFDFLQSVSRKMWAWIQSCTSFVTPSCTPTPLVVVSSCGVLPISPIAMGSCYCSGMIPAQLPSFDTRLRAGSTIASSDPFVCSYRGSLVVLQFNSSAFNTDNVGYTSKRLLSYIANQLSVLKWDLPFLSVGFDCSVDCTHLHGIQSVIESCFNP